MSDDYRERNGDCWVRCYTVGPRTVEKMEAFIRWPWCSHQTIYLPFQVLAQQYTQNLRSDLRFFPLYCLIRTFPKKHFISLDLEIKIEEQRICVSMGTGHMWASLAWGWTVCDYLHCCPEPWPYRHSIASAFRFNSQAFQEAYPEAEFGYKMFLRAIKRKDRGTKPNKKI